MERTVEFSGTSLMFLLYAITMVGIVAILWVVVFPLDSGATVVLALLFVLFGVLTTLGLWRRLTDSDARVRRDAPYDITYDPFAYPGQAAKHNWQKAIRRLQADGSDSDDDEQD